MLFHSGKAEKPAKAEQGQLEPFLNIISSPLKLIIKQ